MYIYIYIERLRCKVFITDLDYDHGSILWMISIPWYYQTVNLCSSVAHGDSPCVYYIYIYKLLCLCACFFFPRCWPATEGDYRCRYYPALLLIAHYSNSYLAGLFYAVGFHPESRGTDGICWAFAVVRRFSFKSLTLQRVWSQTCSSPTNSDKCSKDIFQEPSAIGM